MKTDILNNLTELECPYHTYQLILARLASDGYTREQLEDIVRSVRCTKDEQVVKEDLDYLVY